MERIPAEIGEFMRVPLLSRVGRRSSRARVAIALIYLALILGGVTMVYPFAQMVSTAMKGPTDQNDNQLIPAYLQDDFELFRKFVDDKYAGSVDKLSLIFGESEAIALVSPTRPATPVFVRAMAKDRYELYKRFLQSLEPHEWEAGFRSSTGRWGSDLSTKYQDFLRSRYDSIEELNAAYLEQHVFFQTVQPPTEKFGVPEWSPKEGRKWSEWMEFRETLPLEFRIPVSYEQVWQGFLRTKFRNRIEMLPSEVRGSASGFHEVPTKPGTALYSEFLMSGLPERYRATNPDKKWRQLSGESSLPMASFEWTYVVQSKDPLRREYAGRNYLQILDYVLLHGSAIWNTVIFCALAVLTQLIVNPLAAFALSRYPMKATASVLLFLLATMAFPAEVTMIPGFLLLKDLGLLNTFAALVLPAAASGYSIYLLKGFFDSLPKDYYESGSIDGAKDWLLFYKVTVPLSKPVLAVTALGAFVGAYGAFIYAFLVAQDQRMWTLMVWVYQLQARAPKSTTMAALTVAAIPTLLVFLFAQRVIMRGIILPSEK